MRILIGLLIGLVSLVVLLFVIGLFLPDDTHVERSVKIDAPPATVFALVNDLEQFNRWSPWAERDPDMSYEISDPAAGVGASMSWAGDPETVGSGRMEIIGSEPYQRVETALDFGEQGGAVAFFELEPVEDGTEVTWGFDTSADGNVIGRYMGLMMDKWVGADYQEGLQNLKRLAESLPDVDFSALEIERREVEPVRIVYVSGESDTAPEAIGEALGEAYFKLSQFIENSALEHAGQPLAITRSWGERYEFDAGIPVEGEPAEGAELPEGVSLGETYAGEVIVARHVGPYENLAAAYEGIDAYLSLHGLEPNGNSWEEYVSDPGDTPEEELVTLVYYPVK